MLTRCGFVSSAYCRNSIDGQWYCFDDSEVSPVADEDVCQQTAYILFYQRRTAVPSWSANSSVAGQPPPQFSQFQSAWLG